MIKSISRLSSLLLGVALLLTGHGLQLALVPMRAQINGWTSAEVGYLSSMYFVGFIIGCFTIPPLVSRIGHIRAFAALTAVMTTAILTLSLGNSMLIWFVLRLAAGFSIVGLYLVIESWLNSQVGNEIRGGVLSIYTAIVLAGLALGQLLLNAAPPEGERLFIIASILVVLAAIPVCLTSTRQPEEIPAARFSPMLLINTSRAATAGSFISGCVTGSFYGLAPVFGLEIDMSVAQISLMMALGVAGGAVMQFPLGKLSDHVDRRRVIFGAMLAGTLVAAAAMMLPRSLIPYIMLVFGACAMPIYALSLAWASDFVENESFLEVGTGLLMINAFGSIIGPLVTSQLMYRLGPDTYFASLCLWLLLGSFLVLAFIRTRDRKATHFHEFSPATSAAAQGALQMDPRTDDEEFDHVMEGEIISDDEALVDD